MDGVSKIDEFVNVSLRIRPALSQDSSESSCLQVISKQPPVLFVVDRLQTYHFDNIFTEEVDQETVYNETVKPLVEYVKQGYSCTVFAYGQTGTGKTYTMGTNSQVGNKRDVGLIPRALEHFFTYCDNDIETDISVSFIEIYNEKVFDLLQNNNKPPLTVKGFRVQGANEEKVFNCHEAKHFLKMGNKNRHTSETKQNTNSSRSHAVFTIHCNVRHKQHETTAKLNLVDLAGCESVKKTGNQGSTFQEGVNINKGLLCIGQVMTALSTNSSFVPYRQSIITTILQDSLNKKNLVSLIACVNGNPDDGNETIQTLEFAQRVKKMKNKPEVNEVVMQYKKENPTLFQPIKTANTPFKRPAPLFQTPCVAKRARPLPLTTVSEQSGNSTAVDSLKSLSSISISSSSSNIHPAQQAFSPVIKKYMSAMESSLVDRLESLIKNTLKRPTRSSLMREEQNSGKENSPSMSWNKIQNEVSKLVRTEIAQLTGKATRAASSPIDEQLGFDKIRRVLKYESPVLNESTDKEHSQNDADKSKDNSTEETIFKVPELPITRKKPLDTKRTPSISPIEFEPRRSVRLSLKRNKNDQTQDLDLTLESSRYKVNSSNQNCMNKSSFYESHPENRRCSVRLAKKRNVPPENLAESGEKKRNSNNNNSLDDFDLEATVAIINNRHRVKKRHDMSRCVNNETNDCGVKDRRRSVRLHKKIGTAKTKLTMRDTPAGKKLLGRKASGDSPATAHTKHVLMLLNTGNVRHLEKLHSIGPKTAQQILLFREIKGPLNNISDLSSMPGWHGKKFKIFVEQNFIKNELL